MNCSENNWKEGALFCIFRPSSPLPQLTSAPTCGTHPQLCNAAQVESSARQLLSPPVPLSSKVPPLAHPVDPLARRPSSLVTSTIIAA
uniref:Uncharacterized protein n=1 Tax=Arundo donax TaxID=35708 RepID=A0A0A9F7X6_ARUDO